MVHVNGRVLSASICGVNRYLNNILNNVEENTFSVFRSKARGISGHLWEQSCLPLMLHRNDILWSPSNTGPIFSPFKHIVTIHDIAPLEHPEWTNFNFRHFYRFIIPKIINYSDHIITVSEYTKERILNISNISDSKISVIYNGVDDSYKNKFLPLEIEKMKINFGLYDKRYVLSVSSIEPRKNIKRVLDTWSHIVDVIDDDIWLILVGNTNKRIFSDLGVSIIPPRVKFIGFVEEMFLPLLYQGAELFIYVPFYEGFGLPPLEAMASGTPVITSNKTSIPEVTGSAAMLVEPNNIEEISDAMVAMLTETSLREKYQLLGQERAKNFSWAKTAAKTVDVLLS
ncbi:MAG: D-inositol-3-phosphate glycosyltransferase [Candidatus Celerinatantimonas neptuna]|nr:MAG: D-inositol-3-phosphate glycosyltransferase [Candidatus Celerinatantimonas neptuna]